MKKQFEDMKPIMKALGEFGVSEISGAKHNERILKYFHEIGHNWVKADETAWCSAFVNWCCKETGYERSEQLNARSWLEVGEETENPETGDLVVFWRESPESWKGHVAFFVGFNTSKSLVYVLGGNQGDQVKISGYKVDQILSFRKLSKVNTDGKEKIASPKHLK